MTVPKTTVGSRRRRLSRRLRQPSRTAGARVDRLLGPAHGKALDPVPGE